MRHFSSRCRTAIFLTALSFASNSAQAGSTMGGSALTLAALVGANNPTLDYVDRTLLLAYLDGNSAPTHRKGKVIKVKADTIDCRASNVDLTSHACNLSFGAKRAMLSGRNAHELYATLIENGVAPEGAAGTMHASVSALDCAIDADEVGDKGGGGARCVFS